MAHINSIKLSSSELKELNGKVLKKIKISARLHFDVEDISLKREYQLHLYLLDAKTVLNTTNTFPAGADTNHPKAPFSPRDIQDHIIVTVRAIASHTVIERYSTASKQAIVSLGGVRVFGSLFPVASLATNWSNIYLFDLQLK